MNLLQSFKNLTKFEFNLWLISLLVVCSSAFLSGIENILYTIAAAIGVTALIFVSKGDVIGQIITVIFSIFYGIISLTFNYYGEMITYVFMTTPMAILATISWYKHPFKDREVEVNHISKNEIIFMFILSIFVTFVFYLILDFLNTPNIFFSTLSITTSFIASYLTFRRSPYYALAYSANDIVLMILWCLASFLDIKYLSMVLCFFMFLFNDLYGFINWKRIKYSQEKK